MPSLNLEAAGYDALPRSKSVTVPSQPCGGGLRGWRPSLLVVAIFITIAALGAVSGREMHLWGRPDSAALSFTSQLPRATVASASVPVAAAHEALPSDWNDRVAGPVRSRSLGAQPFRSNGPSPLNDAPPVPNPNSAHHFARGHGLRGPRLHDIVFAIAAASAALVALVRCRCLWRSWHCLTNRRAMAGVGATEDSGSTGERGHSEGGAQGPGSRANKTRSSPWSSQGLLTEYLTIPPPPKEDEEEAKNWLEKAERSFEDRRQARLKLLKCMAIPDCEVMEMPLGRYIPVSLNKLNEGIVQHLAAEDVPAWQEMVMNLECVVSAYYDKQATVAKASYEELQLDEDWSPAAETRLYDKGAELLYLACHRPLTQFWYDFIEAADFTFTTPVLPQWETGSEQLAKFIAQGTVYPQAQTPWFASDVLIFVRGISVQEKTEWFWSRKIDHLIDEYVYGRLPSRALPPVPPHSSASARVQTVTVRRKTLTSHLEDLGLFKWLTTRLTLAEPAFDSVVVCHREVQAGKPRMVLESFRQVCLADLLGVLPVREIELRAYSRLQFGWSLVVLASFIVGIGRTLYDGLHGGEMGMGLYAFLFTILLDTFNRLTGVVADYNSRIAAYELERLTWKEAKKSGEGRVVISDICDQVPPSPSVVCTASPASRFRLVMPLENGERTPTEGDGIASSGGSVGGERLRFSEVLVVFTATLSRTRALRTQFFIVRLHGGAFAWQFACALPCSLAVNAFGSPSGHCLVAISPHPPLSSGPGGGGGLGGRNGGVKTAGED